MALPKIGIQGRAFRIAVLIVLIGGGVFILYTLFLRPKQPATDTSTTTDEAAPKTPSFATSQYFINYTQLADSQNTTTTTTTTTNSGQFDNITNNPIGPELPTQLQTNPTPGGPSYRTYTVRSGDTLSKIASSNGMSLSALYNLNKATVDSWAQRYGYPVSSDPRDNIFPGEPLLIPA